MIDSFDIRDKIERFEELETTDDRDDDDEEEMISLATFLASAKGNGGDHQWRGDWYPVTFIAERNFEEYAEEFAEELGMIKSDASWPYTCIDWEQAATRLQADYSQADYNGTTYLYRS
jgi:hypothetical protein